MIESIYGLILAFCFAGLLVALCFVLYSKKAIKRDIGKVTEDLSRILDENTAEKIMVFTDEKSIMEL